MKTFVITILFGLLLMQLCQTQTVQHSVALEIMTTAVSQSSMDSVPLKFSVPDDIRSSELTFPISEEESGKFFITGTPYDSIQIQVPADISVSNQQGEYADLQDFQLQYGTSDDDSAMVVVSPVGCVTIQMPQTRRINFRLGGTLVSGDKQGGIYTGSIRLDCRDEE